MSAPFLIGAAELGPNGKIYLEIAFGADITASPSTWTWTDVTTDVWYANGITVHVGRADSTSGTQPATLTLSLSNTTLAYSAYHPLSPNWPNVTKNVPIRVRVDPGTGTPIIIFQGEVSGWQPSWDQTGTLPLCAVTAAGISRRLAQGSTPILSPISRSFSVLSTIVAGWTLEDLSASTQFAPVILGQQPGTFSGDIQLASGTGVTGSMALPTCGQTTRISLPGGTTVSGSWTVTWFAQAPTSTPAADTVLVNIATNGTVTSWQLVQSSLAANAFYIQGQEAGGTVSGPSWSFFVPQGPVKWTFAVKPSGSTVDFEITLQSLAGQVVYDSGIFFAPGTNVPGQVTGVSVPAAVGGSGHVFGQVYILDGYFPDTTTALVANNGWAGEQAGARFSRLCAEAGVTGILQGWSTVKMGPQPVGSWLTVVRECEVVDLGVVFDGFGPDLRLGTLSSRYNQSTALTLNAANNDLGLPFTPVDDDQLIRNDWTVSRTNGSSARVTRTTGKLGSKRNGVYNDSLTVNAYQDSPLAGIAGWLTHVGTQDGLRYPTLALDLAARPAQVPSILATMGTLGWRIDVTNLSTVAPEHPPGTISLVVEGWTMRLDERTWTMGINCVSGLPYTVAVVDGTPRVVITGCTLANPCLAGDLSILVDVTNPLTTRAGDFPLNLDLDGETITVSMISAPVSGQQTITITARAVNGVSTGHAANVPINVATKAIVARANATIGE